MRIVITGASGNVGTAVLRALRRADPGHELVGVVRRPPALEGDYRDMTWHAVDLAEDRASGQLTEIFAGADAVIHLAWGFQPTRNTAYLTRLGVGGTQSVLDAAHRAQVPQLVHMSSVGTYAPGRYGERVDESWSTSGVRSSPYSRDKSAAEALLDDYERDNADGGVLIARARPGFIVQRAAASGLMRYALPAWMPMRVLPLLPVLPLDRGLCIPLIHADDVATALVAVVHRRARGAFNLAGEPPLDRDTVAKVLGAKAIQVSSGLLGAAVDLSWRARLQPIDRGWLDLAFSVPLLDTGRARRELQWEPQWSATDALADVLAGVSEGAHTVSPPLRRRSVLEQLFRDLTAGQVTTRRVP